MPKIKTDKTTSEPKSKARKPATVKGKSAKATKKKTVTKGKAKKPAASKAAKSKTSKKQAPLHHSKGVRTECMVLWATGMSMREVAKTKKVGLTTLQRWKGAHSPDNWDTYRDVIIREMQDEQITGVRKQYAGMITREVEDVEKLRKLARQLIGVYAAKMKALNQNGKPKFKLSEAEARTLRHIAYILAQVQQQTRRVFGMPTHRIEADTNAPPLAVFLDDDADIDDLSNKELVAMLGEQLQTDVNAT